MDTDSLHAALTDLARKGEFSGTVRIDSADRTLFEGAYGPASYTWNVPATMSTRYDCASVTKLFTAVATLQQVAAGAFTLQTSAIDYLGLTGTTISPAVTVHHLLSHTSGIGDDADEEAGESYEALWVDTPNYSVRQTADFLPNFVNKPANFAPGKGARYCNVSYILLGLMIEKATGRSYRDYVVEHVFGPAGMSRAGFFAMDRVVPDVAEGVEADDGGWRRNIYSYPPIGSPDGGAHVCAADLLAFHRALRAGELLPAELAEAMITPHATHSVDPENGVVHAMGYGFEISTDPGAVVRSYWKEGVNTGASAMLRHYPGAAVTVAVLSNLEDGVWEPVDLINDAVQSL
ncbi:serine hydrolase domain-containing protein [Pseudactinotalea sp. Z1732]|uniref:serine hydrolase domain-containing protein n=1 Tax=Pseudactinotalea sp. Z1732 TaxID=3413026 RepID=UPI003C7D1155